MGPGTPQADFTDYAQLASRISTHLAKNPGDTQAKSDLQYVLGQMRGPGGSAAAANRADQSEAEGPTTPNPGAAVTSGLLQAGMDIPRSIGNALLHPIQTAGQLTGIGNIGDAVNTFRDPEASTAEKIGAVVRATPLNAGYAPERALLDATGATSDTPAPLDEQARRAGNVASLALLGVNPKTPAAWLGRNVVPKALMPPILSRALEAPTEAPIAADAEEAVFQPAPFQGASPERMGQIRDFLARRNAQLDAEQAARTPSAVAPTVPSDAVPATPTPAAPVPAASAAPAGAATPALRAGESAAPIPNTGGRGIAVTGARTTPPVPQVPTISEIQARLAGMGKGNTLPFYPRGGAAEQAIPPGPVSSMPPSPPNMVAASQPLAEALQPGRFSGVARAMQSPAYQNAEVLAHRALTQGLGPFKGMSLGDATAALRKMILAKVQAGGEIPALTSLPRFLTQLAP